MIKRRQFAGTLGAMAVGITAASPRNACAQAVRTPRRNTLMHVGGDYHSVAGSGITSKENMEYNLRYGVRHLTAQVRRRAAEGGWDPEELRKMKDAGDQAGVVFEAIRMDPDYITLRKGPERDREIARILGNIEKASRIGVSVITYH